MTNIFQKSKVDINRLEISVRVGCGRLCNYCPQNQYIESYRKKFQGEEKFLTLEMVKSIIRNIDKGTVIHWTGFTEPFDCKDFCEIVDLFKLKKFKQKISTTLYGSKKSQNYFLNNLSNFTEGVTLHLPDDENLMKGNFDSSYLEYLRSVLKALGNDGLKYTIFLIGTSFHKEVQKILTETSVSSDKIIVAKYLNTRGGVINPGEFSLMKSESKKIKGSKFYCSYQRLNQGVLLPNGEVTICCQDYGLEGVMGSLKTNKLSELYTKIEADVTKSKKFISGEFYPCKNCEHYTAYDEKITRDRIQ